MLQESLVTGKVSKEISDAVKDLTDLATFH